MAKWEYSYLIKKKTLWENEKLLVKSNFFFSHNVNEQFLLFPQCFQKLSVVDASKWVSYGVKD